MLHKEINFNSDSNPGRPWYATRSSLWTEDKTRSGNGTTIPIDAKCKSRFRIFAIFVERRQPRGRQNGGKKREREGGGCQADAISRNNRCTHIVATLPRYCFTLQNIAFYLRAASSHGLKTRRWSREWRCRVLFILRGRTDKNGRLCDRIFLPPSFSPFEIFFLSSKWNQEGNEF